MREQGEGERNEDFEEGELGGRVGGGRCELLGGSAQPTVKGHGEAQVEVRAPGKGDVRAGKSDHSVSTFKEDTVLCWGQE